MGLKLDLGKLHLEHSKSLGMKASEARAKAEQYNQKLYIEKNTTEYLRQIYEEIDLNSSYGKFSVVFQTPVGLNITKIMQTLLNDDYKVDWFGSANTSLGNLNIRWE